MLRHGRSAGWPPRVIAFGAACCLLTAACAGPFADGEQADRRIGSESADDLNRTDADQVDGSGGGGRVDGPEGSGSAAGGTVAGPAISARFSDGPCPFEPPDGHEPRCGTVAVPMDWDLGEGRVELAVAVFASTAAEPAEDPVVYLDGGPGSHSLDTIEFAVEDFLDPLLARGDVIFLDQRGAGWSTPRLDCPETTEVTRRLEDEPSIDDDQATEAFHDALARCRTRLAGSGIDLTDYNSINNAHDVEAIRLALGYERWNLFGISYGTKLALEVLRRHPEAVRAAVLDSVYPPQVDSVLENPSTFLDSYRLVVAGCAAEPACSAAGDLADRIRAVVARYDADPVRVQVRDWIAGETDDVFVTGETVVEVILGALYSPLRFTDIPELISELEAGKTGAIASFLNQDRTTERFFSNGMFYAIACNEEIAFADRSQVAAALPRDPFGLKEEFDFATNTGSLAFGTCEAFDSGRAPDVANTPVTSDVPTLLMAGVYDPVTPVSWAERAAATLSRSHLVVGPYAGHGVSGGRCGISVVVRFLEDPERAPDDSCLVDEQLSFVVSPDDPVELEVVSYQIEDFGVEVTTVRPVGWSVGSLRGDQYRRRSFLDPAELYQLAGDESLGYVLAEFIGEEHGLSLSGTEPFVGAVGPIMAQEVPRTWDHRQGRSDTVAVEWFETVIDDRTVYVILVSPIDDLDDTLGAVVVPAMKAIDVVAL